MDVQTVSFSSKSVKTHWPCMTQNVLLITVIEKSENNVHIMMNVVSMILEWFIPLESSTKHNVTVWTVINIKWYWKFKFVHHFLYLCYLNVNKSRLSRVLFMVVCWLTLLWLFSNTFKLKTNFRHCQTTKHY